MWLTWGDIQNTSESEYVQSTWRREWHPTPIFLPGEFHGQRSLAGYSPWGCKESDTTEQLTHTPLENTEVLYFLTKIIFLGSWNPSFDLGSNKRVSCTDPEGEVVKDGNVIFASTLDPWTTWVWTAWIPFICRFLKIYTYYSTAWSELRWFQG